MDDGTEARQLRSRQADLDNAIGRGREDEDSHVQMFLGIITRESGAVWPPASPYGPYTVKVASVTGGTSIGSTLSAVTCGRAFVASNLSAVYPVDPSTLSADKKAIVLITAVNGRNVFDFH